MEEIYQGDNQSTDLDLDVGIINETQGDDVSLSDLYGIPVFTEKTLESIEAYQIRQTRKISVLEQHLFEGTVDQEQRMLYSIRNQLFIEDNQLTKTVEIVSKGGDSYTNAIFLIEVISLLFVLGMLIYVRRRKTKREERIRDINYFSGQETDFN